MLKGYLFKTLKAGLSEFVFGFNDKQLDVGIFSGEVVLKDLIIKPNKVNEIFSQMNLPIRLKAGMIGIIKIKVIREAFLTFIDLGLESFYRVCPRADRGYSLYRGTKQFQPKLDC